MKLSVGMLFLLEIAYFVGVILYEQTNPDVTWPTDYLRIIKWTLAVVYGVNILAFVPLFILVMTLLNK